MTKIHPCSDIGRYLDIMRQGFNKPLPKPRKPKGPPPIIACHKCKNWHRKSQHIVAKARG